MIEIERKFLVSSLEFKREAFKHFRIIQGFLNTYPERTVRVRLKDQKGYLTVKGPSSEDGLSRFEWEQDISEDDARALLDLCVQSVIDKTRYEVQSGNHVFEVDVFGGRNEGLILAEVELKSEDEEFISPDWLGEEVTGIPKYYNSQLSIEPFKTWNL